MHIGVVGGGYWGSKHLRVFAGLPGAQSVTLIEQDEARRKSVLNTFPAVKGAGDLDEVLDDLDGVVIATRAKSHVELGLKVLRAGKHVLIEKPMAVSAAEADLLCREAEANKSVLMAGHTFEFNPVVVELKRRILEGELGRIHYIRCHRLNLGLYQSDVNVIWDLAPHDVSIINYLLDDSPTTVTAWGHRSAGTCFEDVGMIRLQYEASNVEAYVHVSWLDPSKVRETTVVGSEKMAVYDDVKSEERLRIFDRGVSVADADTFNTPLSYRYGDITSPFIDFAEPLALEDAHFIEAIQTGRATRADGESGRRVVTVLEAAQRSLDLARPVDISELGSSLVEPVESVAFEPPSPVTS